MSIIELNHVAVLVADIPSAKGFLKDPDGHCIEFCASEYRL